MNKSLLKNRSFVSVWLGNAISELGGAFGTFCNSILIYELTGSTMALGSMWLLYFGPSLVLQLFIGPFIDRWSRKWVMIFSQWVRGIIFLLPLLMIISDSLATWHIYIVQIVVGLISPLYVPANQAIIPTIVPEAHLQTANAYIDGTVRLMTFLAPILGGIVIEFIGAIPTLVLITVSLMVSGLTLLFVTEKRNVQTVRYSWFTEFKEGIAYFFNEQLIVWLGVFLAFVQFGVGVTMVTTLPYITDELNGSYTSYGYFMAGFPVGYIIGTLLIDKIVYKSRRILMLGALFTGGLTFVALYFNQFLILGIVTEIIGGIAMAIFSVHNITILQQVIPNQLMGKVFSVRLLIIRGVMPLGVLLGGILSELWGVRPLYLLIGLVICMFSMLGIVLPYFKFIDDSEQKVKDLKVS